LYIHIVWHDSFVCTDRQYLEIHACGSWQCVTWLICIYTSCDMTHLYIHIVWHDSFVYTDQQYQGKHTYGLWHCVTWLICIYTLCDMTHSYIHIVWHDSFVYTDQQYQEKHSYGLWHCVTWLIRIYTSCDMTHLYTQIKNIRKNTHMGCDIVWHDSFVSHMWNHTCWSWHCVTWLIRIYTLCDMTHLYIHIVWHDSFVFTDDNICKNTHMGCNIVWHDLFVYTHCVTWLIRLYRSTISGDPHMWVVTIDRDPSGHRSEPQVTWLNYLRDMSHCDVTQFTYVTWLVYTRDMTHHCVTRLMHMWP